MLDNTCVCCGKYVPEGRQVCRSCEVEAQKMGLLSKPSVVTNGDRIRAMDDEQLAEWFAPHMMCNICVKNNKPCGCNLNECKKYALAYMKKEVSDA